MMWVIDNKFKLFLAQMAYAICDPLNKPDVEVKSTYVAQFQEPGRLVWPEGYTKVRFYKNGRQIGYRDSIGRWYAEWNFLWWTFELNSEDIGCVYKRCA